MNHSTSNNYQTYFLKIIFCLKILHGQVILLTMAWERNASKSRAQNKREIMQKCCEANLTQMKKNLYSEHYANAGLLLIEVPWTCQWRNLYGRQTESCWLLITNALTNFCPRSFWSRLSSLCLSGLVTKMRTFFNGNKGRRKGERFEWSFTLVFFKSLLKIKKTSWN